jgi:hypothetical protein
MLSDLYAPLTGREPTGTTATAEPFTTWAARVGVNRRTRSIRQKWGELLLSVPGEKLRGAQPCGVGRGSLWLVTVIDGRHALPL